MQDEARHNISGKFVENSWLKLKAQLDAEMPVAKPKDDSIILLGMLMLFILGLFYIQYKTLLIEENKTQVAVVSTFQTKQTTANATFSPSFRNTGSNLSSFHFPLTNMNNITPNHTNKPYHFLGNEPASGHADLQSEDNQQTQNTGIPEGQRTLALPVKVKVRDLNKLVYTDMRISQENQRGAFHKIQRGLNDDTLEDKTKGLGLTLTAGSTLSMSTNGEFTGWGGQLTALLPLADKWGFNIGAGLSFLSRDYTFVPLFGAGKASPEVSKLSQISSGDLEQERLYFKALSNIAQVYIPLGVTFRASPEILLSTGVNLRYTYNEKIHSNLKTAVARQNILKNNTEVENYFFNNTNAGLHAGVAWKPTSKLVLGLNSEWGLSSLIRKDRFDDPSQNQYDLNLINVSVNYIIN